MHIKKKLKSKICVDTQKLNEENGQKVISLLSFLPSGMTTPFSSSLVLLVFATYSLWKNVLDQVFRSETLIKCGSDIRFWSFVVVE